MSDTIFALSSGSPPAAIAIIRISGAQALASVETLAGRAVAPRRPTLALLRDANGLALDEALVLTFPGPRSATGEDLAELHCHGGRAVVAAVERALAAIPGLRRAEPGEFTRRAFANGRIDLAEAEGLAELLSAETELQRSTAMAMAGGAFSRQVDVWRERLLVLSAQVEAALDFSDEDDVDTLPEPFFAELGDFARDLQAWLDRPRAERLGEGFRVILAGPPNAGKSTLFNALVGSEAAITSPTPGTTRDIVERSVSLGGIPFTFADTAGLRSDFTDAVEGIGVERAKTAIDQADLVLWLGEEGDGPAGALDIDAMIDRVDHIAKRRATHSISAVSGAGMDELRAALVEMARGVMPRPGEAALNTRQWRILSEAAASLASVGQQTDLLIVAEALRSARARFDALVGRTTTENMLDALFGRFCIGK